MAHEDFQGEPPFGSAASLPETDRLTVDAIGETLDATTRVQCRRRPS